MAHGPRLRRLLRLAFLSGRNRITMLGATLTTASAISLLSAWTLEVLTHRSLGPYSGIFFFLILPAFFLLGLALIPLGIWRERRRQRRSGTLPQDGDQIDLSALDVRKAVAFLLGATAVNLALFGVALSKGVEYTDSNAFCGQVCHTVMEPEYTAFLESPHSRVGCAQCHIGPGAGWFVKSKLSGTRQLLAVLFKTYSRPVPSPVKDLRPARETCEQCHWPQRFTGDRLIVRTHYGVDEANTPATSVLLLKIGGKTWQGRVGIHGRHLDAGERIRYLPTDDSRRGVSRVVYHDDSGNWVTYAGEGTGEGSGTEWRGMDCVDCHNRPTHVFETPEWAVDRAISDGRISRDLPFVKKLGVDLLKAPYADRNAAREGIRAGAEAFYRKEYPQVARDRGPLVAQAGEALSAIYLKNVFPGMKVDWGIHPNHIGHATSPGCFRCHDGAHATSDGRVITADCDACHTILAQEEPDPKILKDFSLSR